MKYTALILLLLVLGCKNDTKKESDVGGSVAVMWAKYSAQHPESQKDEIPESWFFHDNQADADRLGELTAKGIKQASSGLYAWYKEANADLPQVGTKHIITNFKGDALAIIEIRKVDTVPFNQIPESYAVLDMGTKTDALKKWRTAHWDFFASTMKANQETPMEEMLVVCEYFETIWPK